MVIVVDLETCDGDVKRMQEVINKEIHIWMKVESVTVSDNRKTAVIIYQKDFSKRFSRFLMKHHVPLQVHLLELQLLFFAYYIDYNTVPKIMKYKLYLLFY